MAKLILALDVDTFARAKYFIDKLYPRIKIFKIGLQLFIAAGPRAIQYIGKQEAAAFLDLKFYDIPNTVASAVRQAVRLQVTMLTLHISSGEEALRMAVSACRQEALSLRCRRPLLVGVTVLTSKKTRPQQVLKLASLALSCGLDGIVCSAREARLLRQKLGRRFCIITPGIRPRGADAGGQKRIATVEEAVKAGSDYLVVGRPIIAAADPLQAAKEILAQSAGE